MEIFFKFFFPNSRFWTSQNQIQGFCYCTYLLHIKQTAHPQLSEPRLSEQGLDKGILLNRTNI